MQFLTLWYSWCLNNISSIMFCSHGLVKTNHLFASFKLLPKIGKNRGWDLVDVKNRVSPPNMETCHVWIGVRLARLDCTVFRMFYYSTSTTVSCKIKMGTTLSLSLTNRWFFKGSGQSHKGNIGSPIITSMVKAKVNQPKNEWYWLRSS